VRSYYQGGNKLFLVDTIMDATDGRSRAGRGGVDKGNSEGCGGGYMLFVCDSVLGRISEYIVDLHLWVLYRIILVLTLSKHGRKRCIRSPIPSDPVNSGRGIPLTCVAGYIRYPESLGSVIFHPTMLFLLIRVRWGYIGCYNEEKDLMSF
jgi:hypothetical protein